MKKVKTIDIYEITYGELVNCSVFIASDSVASAIKIFEVVNPGYGILKVERKIIDVILSVEKKPVIQMRL